MAHRVVSESGACLSEGGPLEIFGASDGAARRVCDVHRNNGRRQRSLGVSPCSQQKLLDLIPIWKRTSEF